MVNEHIGERLSFIQIFTKKNLEVEIPMLQRDYAQGRSSKSNLRMQFVDKLHDYLDSGSYLNDLDFIYGNVITETSKSKFIPLDGQQRLTTLFLLHWYLSRKSHDAEKHFSDNLQRGENAERCSKFSYKTRVSSSEFCDAIVCNTVQLDKLLSPTEGKNDELSKTIKNEKWYFSAWSSDPTVKSMLSMLDTIHAKFKNSDGEKMYFRLIDEEKPPITFLFLNMNELSLTDALYIKMNSRGKQLTPFENFKALFEDHITKLNESDPCVRLFDYGEHSQKVPLQDYFSFKCDAQWADVFWHFKKVNTDDNSFDDELMNFIRVIFTDEFALSIVNREKELKKTTASVREKENTEITETDIAELKKKIEKRKESLEYLLGTDEAKRQADYTDELDFYTYTKYGVLESDKFKIVKRLIYTLDILHADEGKIKTVLLPPYNAYYKEVNIFENALKHKFDNFTQRVQFYVYLKLLVKLLNSESADYQHDPSKLSGVSEKMGEWMRVIRNLTENSDIDRADRYLEALAAVEYLISTIDNILEYLSSGSEISGFNKAQIEEERIKAKLISLSESWKNAILDIEKVDYFKGQIGFLLKFSGILDYYEHKNDFTDWTAEESDNHYNLFLLYSEKIKSVFEDNGLREIDDFLWERALLTKGNYLLKSGSNYHFLKSDNKAPSWKRLLSGSDYDEQVVKRDYVQALLDDENFDVQNVSKGLKKIINSSKDVNDWRKGLIKHKEMIKYCKDRMIRYEKKGNYIILLSKTQLKGYHTELYSYSFYFDHLVGAKFPPFQETSYYYVTGDKENPCAVVNKWIYKDSGFAIDIRYNSAGGKYELRFFDREGKEIDGINEVKSILVKHKFTCKADGYVRQFSDENIMLKALKNLCDSFTEMLK